MEDGTFNFYLDGGLVGTYVDADFTGGYFGLMTNGGDVTFNNVNYYPAQNPRITDMQLSGAQLSEPYVEGKAEYLAVADEGSDSVSIILTAPKDFVLSVDKQECESGVAATVPLNAIGYTNISIKAEDPVGHILVPLPAGAQGRGSRNRLQREISSPVPLYPSIRLL